VVVVVFGDMGQIIFIICAVWLAILFPPLWLVYIAIIAYDAIG